MRTFLKFTLNVFLSGKRKTNIIYWSVLTVLMVMVLSTCKKDLGTSSSFPVNESFAADLIGKGVPTDIAQFYAAARLVSNRLNDTTCTYLITFPNGATREITLNVRPNRKHTPTPEEIANITPGKSAIYDFHYMSSMQADSTTKIVLTYFVASSSLPAGATQQPQSSNLMAYQTRGVDIVAGETEGAGISWVETEKKGADVTIGTLIDFAKEKKIHLGPLGDIYALASALNDVTTALEVSQENSAWLTELAALKDCAANPTNQIAKNDPNYSPSTVAGIEAAQGELKQVNSVRFLNLMTEKAADLNPVTAVLAVGLKQGFEWS